MAWSTWINRPSGRPNARAILDSVGATARTFSWTVRLLIPVAALIAFSVLHAGGYRIAGSVPFTLDGFVTGYGGTLHLVLGLPDAVPDWAALALGAAATAAGWYVVRRRAPQHAALYLIFLVGLPLAMFLARLPNPHFPRYYLAPAIVLLLLLADLFAAAWNRGGAARLLGLALIAAIAIGNAADDWRLLRDGRDRSAAVMQLVGGAGPVLITTDQDVRNRPIIQYFADRFDLPITYVAAPEICARQPQWLLSSSDGAEMPDVLDTSVLGCRKLFEKHASFPQWGLSGLPWTVYRALD